jgi:hypothetical protein
MRSMPSMFSVGNHESNDPSPGQIFNSTDGGGECGVVSMGSFTLMCEHGHDLVAAAGLLAANADPSHSSRLFTLTMVAC